MAEASPRLKARIAGAFYLLTFVAGGFAAFAGGRPEGYRDAANLIATAGYVAVTLLFYGLFKPVSKGLSLLAMLVGLLGCAVGALTSLHVSIVPINALVFFGIYCLLIGYLIIQSRFLPSLLGVLLAIGGLGWLTFASPALAHQLSPYNMAPGMIGEGALMLWLLIVGLNAQRWQEQAGGQ